MTGAEFYELDVATKEAFMIGGCLFRRWDELSTEEKADWERKAFEQDLRDRDESAIVSGRKEG